MIYMGNLLALHAMVHSKMVSLLNFKLYLHHIDIYLLDCFKNQHPNVVLQTHYSLLYLKLHYHYF